MVSINGFYLSKYRETEGIEGYGYCATLKYGKTTAASYADYATGAMPDIEMLPGDEWRAALDETLKGLRTALPGPRIFIDHPAEQVETMCQILSELIEAQKSCRKITKGTRFAVLLLIGNWLTFSPELGNQPSERGSVNQYELPSAVQDFNTAKKWAVRIFERARAQRTFLTCSGVWIIDVMQKSKINLSTEQYADIFKLAGELSAQQDGGSKGQQALNRME